MNKKFYGVSALLVAIPMLIYASTNYVDLNNLEAVTKQGYLYDIASEIETSLSEADKEAYLAQSTARILDEETMVPFTVKSDNVYAETPTIIDGGTVAYANGLVKQSTIVVFTDIQKSSDYDSYIGIAVDDWYSISKGQFIGSVSLGGEFEVDGWEANVVNYGFSYESEYQDSLLVQEKNTSEDSSQGTSNYAQIETDYYAYSEGNSASASISLRCDKDGNITRYGDNECV